MQSKIQMRWNCLKRSKFELILILVIFQNECIKLNCSSLSCAFSSIVGMERMKEEMQPKPKPLAHEVESEDEFNDQLKNAGDKLVVVDFFATWCGPCNNIAKHVESLAQKYASQVVVLKLNVDKVGDVANDFKVFGLPTFIFFKKGEVVQRWEGADIAAIEELTNKLK